MNDNITLWEEKNSIEPKKNSENKNGSETNDITKSTEIELKNEIWKDIIKNWERNCPSCNRILYHTKKSTRDRFIREQRKCKSCSFTGRKYSKEHNLKQSLSKKGKPSPMKGKKFTKEQLIRSPKSHKGIGLGRRHSLETKQKMSIKAKGRIISEEQRKKISHSKLGKSSWNKGKKFSLKTRMKMSKNNNKIWLGKKLSKETKLKMRLTAIKNLKENRKSNYIANYNTKACEYFDKLNREKEWNLQHALNGNELEIYGYFLDAYDKTKNIVVEYDEQKHYNLDGTLKQKDIERMNNIKDFLKCKFYRYNELTQELKEY